MVGFERETEMLIQQLVTGPRELDVISIFGMPGLGKTTLAKKLYDHQTLLCRFDVRLWCCSSQSYDKRALLFQLSRHTSRELDDSTKMMSNNELAEKLYRSLKGKRYLIVVDDVWSHEAWDDIKRPFPDDNNRSRIILTRIESIATYAMISSNPHHLRLFTEEESWLLMKEEVFKEENCYCPKELEEIGKKIAIKCGGLPLAIVLVAGLLAKHDPKEVVYWQEVSESLKSKMNGCMDIIESSYQHLSSHLKRCLLYFASFLKNKKKGQPGALSSRYAQGPGKGPTTSIYCTQPPLTFLEDEKIPVKKLIRLWIAEDFVEVNTPSMSLELVAMDYLMDLIRSNLVMVAKTNSLGELKAVHTHDLIHEFITVKSEKENFLRMMHESWTRRIGVDMLAPLVSLRCPPGANSPLVVNSLMDLTKSWRHLRVLDLGCVSLRQTIVDALQYLINLKYLELRIYFLEITRSICNLKELETFIVTGQHTGDDISNTIWDMKSFRHLHIRPLYMQIMPLGESEDLHNLQTCSDLVIFPGIGYQSFMKRFPNLLKLHCRLCGSGTTLRNFFPAFDSLVQLKALSIDISTGVLDSYDFDGFTYPSSLKKLTLARIRLPWHKISDIGRLSNLEVLKLESNTFTGGQWDIKDREFRDLKVLKLKNLEFSEWNASDDSFPSLQQVVVQQCWNLEEIPKSFGSKCTMELIEVRSCRYSVVKSALKIQDIQIEDMGNSEFKVIISK